MLFRTHPSTSVDDSQVEKLEGVPGLGISDLERPTRHGKAAKPKRGAAFWFIFGAVCVTIFLAALDTTDLPTAVPIIVNELGNGHSLFAWMGSAYFLASAAWLPLSGALADTFGRQPVLLSSLIFFFVGCVICGEAHSSGVFLVGRTIQGLGCGGILSLAEIIIADLVPLKERGAFMGLTGLTYSVATAMGPPIGGVFAQKVSWRWLFRIQLPLTFGAFCLVAYFLRLKVPPGSIQQKLRRIDWTGNALVCAATVAVSIALTRGGIEVPWSSAQTLVPLIFGLLGLIAFFVYEARWAANTTVPTIPFDLLTNRTSVSGFLGTFWHSIVSVSFLYLMPAFFQACFGADPVQSGIDTLSYAFVIAPGAIVGGVSVVILKRYTPQIYIGWIIITVGVGLLSLEKATMPTARWVGFNLFVGFGFGILWTAIKFPILSPLPLARNGSALALFVFLRTFAQIFGITIGSAVLQNELQWRLPADFRTQFPGGAEFAIAAIPVIPQLPEPLQGQVKEAFAASMSTLWKVMLAFCFLGVASALLMREIPLHNETDENWDLSEGQEGRPDGQRGSDQHSREAEMEEGEEIEMDKGVVNIGPLTVTPSLQWTPPLDPITPGLPITPDSSLEDPVKDGVYYPTPLRRMPMLDPITPVSPLGVPVKDLVY
ncbi:MFS multidrug transporter [Calocera cornea HHB12733]|uniref:MFS multidrug transporter n=1 Tax=Calocera cornea HHB12733 TaxID=1353952 RepID=A0A165I5P9_9BASI|nr:MFS multidrug transporter [Calocera cornea HHB12733]